MVLAIVGKTCSGKDTVARYIEERYGFKRIVTYTTRPMRADDSQGGSHNFLTEKEFDSIDKSDIFSPTTINGYVYFTLKSQFLGLDAVCILDPKGVADVKALGVDCKALYVDLAEDIILSRAEERGDDVRVVKARLDDERERFDKFLQSESYDFYINNAQSPEILKACVDLCMSSIYQIGGAC